MLAERWRTIPDFEGLYEVSDHGRVRSLDRIVRKRVVRGGPIIQIRRRGKVLSLSPDSHGYPMVNLCSDGQQQSSLVHHLVLNTFVGPRKSGQECRHLDGNRANNELCNLTWGTALENALDKKRHGTAVAPKGGEHGLSTLTVSDVRSIRRDIEREPSAKLARAFGISQAHVRRIARRKAWAWLD
jgi:hypothetical protein